MLEGFNPLAHKGDFHPLLGLLLQPLLTVGDPMALGAHSLVEGDHCLLLQQPEEKNFLEKLKLCCHVCTV